LGTPDSFYDIETPRFRQLFRELQDHGNEIGLQASYLAYQSHETLAAEKLKLEAASGQPVQGNRHHYLHLNPADEEETLYLHEKTGLRYDATLMHNFYLGFRRGLSHPYFPFHQRRRSEIRTLQMPTAWMDDHFFRFAAINPGDPDTCLRSLADQVVRQGGYLLVDVHDYVYEDDLFPRRTALLRRLWTYLLERGDFWFATPGEVADHWGARHQALSLASSGLNGELQCREPSSPLDARGTRDTFPRAVNTLI
jgi:hypothetical protein